MFISKRDLIVEILIMVWDSILISVTILEPARLGLSNMRERACELEATFEIDTRPGEGTQIKVSIPRCYKETGA